MEQHNFRKLLKKYLSGCASEYEIQVVEKWYEEMGNQRGKIGEANETTLEGKYITNIMSHVKRSDPSQMAKVKSFRSLPRYFVGIAACVLLLIVSLFALTKKSAVSEGLVVKNEPPVITWKYFANKSTVAQRYNLPDGSTINLQPNSNVKFSSLFNLSLREVQLEGEGFFDVTPCKDKPFVVYANDITTKVLGTSFTVRSFRDDKEVKVVVKTGKVSVLAKSAVTPHVTEEIILTPNQEIVYDRAEKIVERRIVEEPQPIVLEEEIKPMRFEDAPLKDVVEAIEKLYGVNIEYDDSAFAACTLTTSVSIGGLYNRIDIITSAIGATYEVKEDKILIKGVGCTDSPKNN